jgi:hypothetical protein
MGSSLAMVPNSLGASTALPLSSQELTSSDFYLGLPI